jgi:hypothetical protein
MVESSANMIRETLQRKEEYAMLMHYPSSFFDLQLAFARKIAGLSHQPYREAILHCTALYRNLGLDWSFDPGDPVWQAYMQGLHQEIADGEWTYQFYLWRFDQLPHYRTPR